MARPLIVCALLAAWPAVASAQEQPAATETVVRLTVQPRAAPRPALKYQLLPELREMQPGNPIHGYLLCFMEQQHFFFNKESVANREKWQNAPLADLPLKELRGYGGLALRQADYAARLDAPDWQVLLRARRDGFHLLIPEVQQLRTLASALKVRFRAEVAERRFDDAVTTAKTLFALARHMGAHPSLIGDLVGIALASITLGPLEEMVQQPGCPNLYWALTNLPQPLIDVRGGLQGERLLIDVELGRIDPAAPMSDARLQEVVARLTESLRFEPKPKVKPQDRLNARVADEGHVRAARRRLVEAGLAEARVNEFPALQVILLDEKHAFEVRRDEETKWLALPYWQAEAGYQAAEAGRARDELLLEGLLAAGLKVRLAQARLDQRFALLRIVEALRLHAAAHAGKLPVQLADIEVPLPVDPISGKPFAYKLEGETAVLRGTPPKGHEKTAAFNMRFVVTLRK